MIYNYQNTKEFSDEQLVTLYGSVGWHAYTGDLMTLKEGISNSLRVISIWKKEELIGLVRVVGDGQTIIYIQDILVAKDFQNQGLGSILLTKILTEYQHVRQKVLMTEESPDIRHFYEKHGFSSCDQGRLVAFAIF